jgi:hypothetical protein
VKTMHRRDDGAKERKSVNSRGHYDHRRVPASVEALQRWTSCAGIETSIALAFAGEEAGDWRVSALTWLYARDERGVKQIAYRLALAAEAAARIARIRIRPELVEVAVADAMRRVRRDRNVPSARERGLQLKVSDRTVLVLRDQAEVSLRRALEWAMQRYVAACGYAFKPEKRESHEQADPIARAA